MLDVIFIASALSAGAPKQMNMPVVCGDAAIFEGVIAGKFAEKPVAMGIGAKGQMMTLFTSVTGDWTLMTRLPDGSGCMIGTGNSLSVLSPKFGDPS